MRARPAPAFLLFLAASLIVIASTRDPIIIVTCAAVAIWALAGQRSQPYAWLLLLIGVIFFYPEFSDSFNSATEKVVVEAVLLTAACASLAPGVARLSGAMPGFALLAFAWIVWAAASYVPVLATWGLESQLGISPPVWLRTLYTQSSAIKAAAPILFAPLAVFLPPLALRDESDCARFVRHLVGATAVLLFISFSEWFAGGHVVAYDPSRLLHNERMTGFSMPDPNGFARLLLLPLLCIAASVIASPQQAARRLMLLIFLAGMLAVALTQSRTSYISLSCGLATLAVLHIRRRSTLRLVAIGATAFVCAFVLLGLREAFSPGSERLSLTSFFYRVDLWKGVVAILQNDPWFGAHPGGYIISLRELGYPEWRIFSPHNMYLYLGAEWGVPMMVLGVLLLTATAATALQVRRLASDQPAVRALADGTLATTVAYVVHGIPETIPPLFLFLVAGLTVAARGIAQRERVAQ